MLSKSASWVKALGCGLVALALGWNSLATAQTILQPPQISVVDDNGVNLANGQITLPPANVSIGGQAGGIGRLATETSDNFSDTAYINAYAIYLFMYVSYGGQVYRFNIGTAYPYALYDGPFDSMGAAHARLTCNGPTGSITGAAVCTMTLPDGTKVDYLNSLRAATLPAGTSWGSAKTITKADGEIIDLNYYLNSGGSVMALKSANSSTGWMLHYEVDSSYKLTKVKAINTSQTYCDPTASSCAVSTGYQYATSTTTGTSTTIALNGTTVATYNTAGPTTITSPSGLTKTFTYTSGKVTKVTLGTSEWNYAYTTDSSGNGITTVTKPAISGVQDTYSAKISPNQLLLSRTDELGRTVSYGYDDRQRIYAEVYTDKLGNNTGSKQYTYMPYHNVSGQVADNRNLLTKITQFPAGGGTPIIVSQATYTDVCDTTNYKYCSKPLTTTDANGVITTYTYHAASGNVATVTLPAPASGGVAPQTRYTYTQVTPHVRNASGTLVASPAVWRLSYTSTCMTLATCSDSSNPSDQLKTGYTYETNHGLPASTILTHGNPVTATTASLTTSVTYNSLGDVIVTDGPQAGAVDESYTFYDAFRRAVGSVSLDPDGTGVLKRKAVKTSYDVDGRVISVESGVAGDGLTAAYSGTTAADRWTQASTDWAAQTVQQKDTTSYSTSNGLPIISRHYDGSTLSSLTQVSYDLLFRKACVVQRMNPAVFSTVTGTQACTLGTEGTDGPDRIAKYTYDAVSNIVSTTAAYGTTLAQADFLKTYNASTGLLDWIEDAKGNRTSYTYDGFNRPTKTCYPNKTTIHSSSTTDCEQTSYRSTTLAGASQLGTLVNTTTLRDGQVNTFSYDNIGRLKGKAGPVPDAVTYDNFNRIKTHTQNGLTETYIYDTAGWLLSDVQGMGTVTYTYDAYGQRNRLTYPGTGLYVTYTYNTGGYLTAIKENGTTNLATYAYDDYSRPTTVSFGNGYGASYGYDARSRLQTLNNTVSGSSNLITLGYNQGNSIMSRVQSNASYEKTSPAAGTTTLANNGLNQIATSGSSTLSYDARGNMSSDGAVSYSYNANNLLFEASTYHLRYDAENRLRLINSDTTSARQFLYDGVNLIAEYSSTGALVRRYVHGPASDNPIVWYEGTGTATKYFFQADERGSITAVTNGTGVVQAIYSYDEYGVPQTNSGSLASPFRYTGQVWLPEIGLYYYKARMYAPSLGRFIQTDPIGYGDGMNMYAYVGNNPVNVSDTTGKCGEIGATDDSGNCHYGTGGLEASGMDSLESWSTWSYGGHTYGGITSQSQADIRYAAAVNAFNAVDNSSWNGDFTGDGASLVRAGHTTSYGYFGNVYHVDGGNISVQIYGTGDGLHIQALYEGANAEKLYWAQIVADNGNPYLHYDGDGFHYYTPSQESHFRGSNWVGFADQPHGHDWFYGNPQLVKYGSNAVVWSFQYGWNYTTNGIVHWGYKY
jgi:RHS repeat-associated protein